MQLILLLLLVIGVPLVAFIGAGTALRYLAASATAYAIGKGAQAAAARRKPPLPAGVPKGHPATPTPREPYAWEK